MHRFRGSYRHSRSFPTRFNLTFLLALKFFITSTVVDGIVIENQIGDALVKRIIQAHNEGTAWRACIVIPLLPGFTYPIDSDAASSVRLIVECQNKSICRGPNSIFGRLRQEGIDVSLNRVPQERESLG